LELSRASVDRRCGLDRRLDEAWQDSTRWRRRGGFRQLLDGGGLERRPRDALRLLVEIGQDDFRVNPAGARARGLRASLGLADFNSERSH
jgi:hypothetical protein